MRHKKQLTALLCALGLVGWAVGFYYDIAILALFSLWGSMMIFMVGGVSILADAAEKLKPQE